MDESFLATVEKTIADLGDPLGPAKLVVDEGTWHSLVIVEDGDVIWRFVNDRGVVRLEANPSWAAEESFDADLLARYLLLTQPAQPDPSLTRLMQPSVRDLTEQLALLRSGVHRAFLRSSWEATRSRLIVLGHERATELFGKWAPTEESA